VCTETDASLACILLTAAFHRERARDGARSGWTLFEAPTPHTLAVILGA